MKVLPDRLVSETEQPEERFDRLGKALFGTDPANVRERLKAEEEAREKANGTKPRKRGRPKRNP